MTNHTGNSHHRRSIRLPDYDYTRPGAYFITVCTHKHQCLFGEVVNGEMQLNDGGRMVQAVWNELPIHYPNVETDAFMVMPNHVHGIIVLTNEPVGAAPRGRPFIPAPCCRPDGMGQAQGPAPTMSTMSLWDVLHRFKTLTTKLYTDGVKQSKWPPFDKRLWQRSYYEHVVRRTDKMNRIREYIHNNPLRWELDRENPQHAK